MPQENKTTTQPTTQPQPAPTLPTPPTMFPLRREPVEQLQSQNEVIDYKEKYNTLSKQHKALVEGLQKQVGIEGSTTKVNSNNVINLIEKKFKSLDERFEEQKMEQAQKDYENRLQIFGKELGLKSADQLDYLDFKIQKLYEAKGDLTDEDYSKIGKEVQKHYSINVSSSVSPKDPGPSQNITGENTVKYEEFKKMDFMTKNEFYKANPELYAKYNQMDVDKSMNAMETDEFGQ